MGLTTSISLNKTAYEEPEFFDIPTTEVVILGAPMVGKTLLFQQLLKENIRGNYITTVGIEPRKLSCINQSITLWDTLPVTGEINNLHQYIINQGSIFIVVFSLLNPNSFITAKKICSSLDQYKNNPRIILYSHQTNGVYEPYLEIEKMKLDYINLDYINEITDLEILLEEL